MASARPRRYAEALFAIAGERGTLDEWRQDLNTAVDRLGSEQTLHLFLNPELGYEQAQAVIERVLGSETVPEVVNLLMLLVRRQQLGQLAAVAARFDELVNQARRIEKATVRTAVPLTAPELEFIQQRLAQRRQASSIILEQQVDPGMVGGIVVRIGDTLLDGSVDARLATLRQALLRER